MALPRDRQARSIGLRGCALLGQTLRAGGRHHVLHVDVVFHRQRQLVTISGGPVDDEGSISREALVEARQERASAEESNRRQTEQKRFAKIAAESFQNPGQAIWLRPVFQWGTSSMN
jgi:hypothetical protein